MTQQKAKLDNLLTRFYRCFADAVHIDDWNKRTEAMADCYRIAKEEFKELLSECATVKGRRSIRTLYRDF